MHQTLRYTWFCTNGVPLKVSFERKFHEISWNLEFLSFYYWYFVTKFGTHIYTANLQPCAKFRVDILILSGPIGGLKIYGNLTSGKILLVTPAPEIQMCGTQVSMLFSCMTSWSLANKTRRRILRGRDQWQWYGTHGPQFGGQHRKCGHVKARPSQRPIYCYKI